MADKEVSFEDLDKLVAAAERLSTEGWEVVAQDVPDAGVVGFMADRGLEKVFLSCALYGLPLEPEVTVCRSWTDFVKALEDRSSHEMAKSDDLEGGQVGFVTYGRSSEGKSEVFRIDVSALKAGGEVARSSLMAILLRSQRQAASEGPGPSEPSPASGGR